MKSPESADFVVSLAVRRFWIHGDNHVGLVSHARPRKGSADFRTEVQ